MHFCPQEAMALAALIGTLGLIVPWIQSWVLWLIPPSWLRETRLHLDVTDDDLIPPTPEELVEGVVVCTPKGLGYVENIDEDVRVSVRGESFSFRPEELQRLT